ncbi:MAG: exodeoxyribonuclease V subunit gamma [Clostridia bacterium]|nr:exodeoxyribonuclease V subunit gamma [Clostridia bacterium]
MLHFVLGRAGTGKTARIADEIAREIAATDRPVVLLVPEQQTVAWETKMAARLPASANLRLEITNFTRLANSVFREYGGLADSILDEGSRILLVWRAMLSVRDALTVYRAPENAKNAGAREDRSLPKLLRAVDDFKTAGISPADAAAVLDRLEALSGDTDPDRDSSGDLLHRMRDAVLVYAAYEELLHEPAADASHAPGMDRGDLFHHLLASLRLHPYFRGKAVFVDSFFSLTAPEEKILDLLFRQADEVWVTFACPPADALSGDEFQFAEVRDFYKTAVRLANRANIPFERIALTENHRHKNAPLLARVEENLFRYAAGSAFSSDPDHAPEIPEAARHTVEIQRCADLWDEAEACASRIDRLLREGYACRDIAVVARNIDTRAGITDAVLRAHGIPCFLSESTAVSHSPAVRLVLAALSVEANGWQRRDVLRLIKTGLTPAGDADPGNSPETSSPFSAFAEDAFEQYAAVWNIRGRRMFTVPRWSMNPAGYKTEFTPAARALLDEANAVKDRVIPPLDRFLSLFAEGPAPVRDIAAGIVALAEDYDIARRLCELGDACRALGLPADAMRAESSWDAVCRILDSMVDLLGDTALDAGRFAGLFSRAAAALDTGTIPTGQDEVVLGSASGVRFDEARCVIMLGVTDGEFPGSVSDGPSFFDDRDKQILEAAGLPIGGPDTAMQSAREAFMFYRTAASASETLLLLAPADGGKTLSEGARRIGDILSSSGCPGVRSFGELPLSEILYHPATAEYLLSRRPDPEEQALLRTLIGAGTQAGVPLTGVSDRIAPAAAKGASSRMRLSQSRIEAFLTCPFKYACRYRVKLEEPAEARITAADVGTFVHAVLERYFTEVPPSDTPVSEEEMRAAASRIIGEYMDALGQATGGDLSSDGRLTYLFRRLERHVLVFLRAISEEMAQSAFRPAAFEMPIGHPGRENEKPGADPLVIHTPDGADVTLDGVADRVDVWQDGGREYLRIVDYKTGSKSFSLERVARGLDVQTLLYLFAVWKNGLPEEKNRRGSGPERIPAGAVYFTVKPQPPSADHLLTAEEARDLAKDKIERTGVWLNDEEVLHAMDRDLSGRFVPVKEGKDGSLSVQGKSSLATLEEFGAICEQVDRVIGQIADRIRSGSAEARPQNISNFDPCAACPHRVICRRREE